MLLCQLKLIGITTLLPLRSLVLWKQSAVFASNGSRRQVSYSKTNKNIFEEGCLRQMHRRYHNENNDEPQQQRSVRNEDGYSESSEIKRAVNVDDKKYFHQRVCNSDDRLTGNDNCLKPKFDNYFEVRIGSGDWDESFMIGWIYQIVLSEMLGVPATIEGHFSETIQKLQSSFYGKDTTYFLPEVAYPLPAMVEASNVNGDCSTTNKKCVHIIPSAWEAGRQDAEKYQKSGEIANSAQNNGITGKVGFVIPIRTVRRDPTLASHFGLRGEENRKKLASTFKTPLNWKDYCSLASSNCTHGDSVATSHPLTAEEEASYFVEGSYTGHFHLTDRNNCTLNESNCTGHITTPTCSWTNYAEAQLYWNNVFLISNGSLEPNNGYELKHIQQIYKAAEKTQSDVIIWFWTPDKFEQSFVGTDYEMIFVAFPRPTNKCLSFRQEMSGKDGGITRCSTNFMERVGSSDAGSCDYPTELQTKIISNGLITATYTDTDEAIRSPALDFLNSIVLPLTSIDEILLTWGELQKSGEFDDPGRESLCQWVYNNTELLERFIPRGYPRERVEVEYHSVTVIGSILGTTTLVIVGISICLIVKWRFKRQIVYAQVNALLITATGYGLLSLACISGSMEPSIVSCTLTQWFTRLGYIIGLVPTLVKLFTIKNLLNAGSRFQRADIDVATLRKVTSITTIIWVSYLIAWTIIDAPRPTNDYILSEEESLVTVHTGCASNFNSWRLVSLGVEGLLLFSITLLTYICSGVIEELNESRSLSFMVYSHFLFLLMRFLFFFLMQSETLLNSLYSRIDCLLSCADALTAICIYLGPKFYLVITTSQYFHSTRNIHMKRKKRFERPSSFASNDSKTSRYRQISGVRIPEGGIPNLIVKRNSENESQVKSATKSGNEVQFDLSSLHSLSKNGDSLNVE